MTQIAQLQETHARKPVALHSPRRRECRKIAIGKRQDGNVAGGLTEIDRLDDIVKTR